MRVETVEYGRGCPLLIGVSPSQFFFILWSRNAYVYMLGRSIRISKVLNFGVLPVEI